MSLQLTPEQAKRWEDIKTGKWHDYPFGTSRSNTKKAVNRSE